MALPSGRVVHRPKPATHQTCPAGHRSSTDRAPAGAPGPPRACPCTPSPPPGATASMKIFGVEILNKGNGVSIDDAVSEMRATFLRDAQDRFLLSTAQAILAWTALSPCTKMQQVSAKPQRHIGPKGDPVSLHPRTPAFSHPNLTLFLDSSGSLWPVCRRFSLTRLGHNRKAAKPSLGLGGKRRLLPPHQLQGISLAG